MFLTGLCSGESANSRKINHCVTFYSIMMVQPQSLKLFLVPLGKLHKLVKKFLSLSIRELKILSYLFMIDLSVDQRYFWEIYQAISGGQWPTNLTEKHWKNVSFKVGHKCKQNLCDCMLDLKPQNL